MRKISPTLPPTTSPPQLFFTFPMTSKSIWRLPILLRRCLNMPPYYYDSMMGHLLIIVWKQADCPGDYLAGDYIEILLLCTAIQWLDVHADTTRHFCTDVACITIATSLMHDRRLESFLPASLRTAPRSSTIGWWLSEARRGFIQIWMVT